MNVVGIGVDLVENARIRQMLDRHGAHFLKRVFTEAEQAYCGRMKDPTPFYAARFAAKEAVSKAFGTGIGEEIAWCDIEVTRAESGQPGISLTGSAARLAAERRVAQVLITLSHTENYAIAQAMLLGEALPHESTAIR